MKTQEELKQIRQEVESLSNKLSKLTDEVLMQVTGGEGQQQDIVKAIKEKLCYVALDYVDEE